MKKNVNLVGIEMVEHLVMVRQEFVVSLGAVTWAVVQLRRRQQKVAVVVPDVVDCNAHRAVHHRMVDIDLVRQQIVDFAAALVEMVSPADKVAVVQRDIVVFRQVLIIKNYN